MNPAKLVRGEGACIFQRFRFHGRKDLCHVEVIDIVKFCVSGGWDAVAVRVNLGNASSRVLYVAF